MGIPFAITKISVYRSATSDEDVEPYEDPASTRKLVASGVRASISSFGRRITATEYVAGGSETVKDMQLSCDIPESGLTHMDWVMDETTGIYYQVEWFVKRIGLGSDHINAGIKEIEGLQ